MKYYFIANPGSRTGHGQELWNSLEEKIKASGIEYEAFLTKGEGDATRIAEKICAEHPEMKRIVISGGDGTANEAVNGLSDYSNIILGYIPTGSSNDLARGLGIRQDPAAALERVLKPHEFRDIDHGVVEFFDGPEGERHPGVERTSDSDSRKFAVSSGIGYDADICYEAIDSPLKCFLNKIHLGKLIYYLLGIKLIFTNKRAKAEIVIDGVRRMKIDGLMFAAAMNTRYEGGGMPMSPEADPSDGKVSVCLVHDISKIKHMMLMPSIIKSKHVNHKGVDIITCKTFEITTDRPLVIHTDGEYAGKHDHVIFSCLPEQIKMML